MLPKRGGTATMSVDLHLASALSDLKARLSTHYGERLAAVLLTQPHDRRGEDLDPEVLIVLRGPTDLQDERKLTLAAALGVYLEHQVLITDIVMTEDEYLQNPSYHGARSI